METVKAKKYRPKSEQKIIKTDGVYFCVEDEGSGSGKCRSGFKNCSRNSVQKHQSKAHYRYKLTFINLSIIYDNECFAFLF